MITLRPLVWCVAGGLALGAATLGLQALLPGHLNQLANSGAVWAAGAFAAGAALAGRSTGRGGGWYPMVAGLLVLLGADLGYYACTTVLLGQPITASSVVGPVVWGVVAVL